jgi:hypothetical protein
VVKHNQAVPKDVLQEMTRREDDKKIDLRDLLEEKKYNEEVKQEETFAHAQGDCGGSQCTIQEAMLSQPILGKRENPEEGSIELNFLTNNKIPYSQ